MKRACLDCGASFEPRHQRERRCPIHQDPFDAAQASYKSPEHRAARDLAIAEAGGECGYCGSTERLTLHHLDPKRAGGRDDHSLILCGRCHTSYEQAERHDRDTPLRRFVRARRAR